MTDNKYRYFTPTGSDTFDAGWYLLDDDGMRQGNVTSAAFAGADTMIIDSNTPTSSPLTAGADNDVYLVTTDAPTGVVEISDDIGMNTIRFDTGVTDFALFTFQNVGVFEVENIQLIITTANGTSIQITTPDKFVFEFADTGHALHGLSLTAQQMVDYVADKPIFEKASYTVDAAENVADDAAMLTLSGRDKTTATGDLTYTLKVASDIFEISAAGVISLKDGVSLDYETAPNSYDLVVVISDGTNTTEANVTINVTNIDEGAATFTVTGTPKVGYALTADKATDDADGNGTFTFQWFTEDSDGGNKADITGATSQSYTPVAADAGKKIGVRVTYTDVENRTEGVEETFTTPVAAADPVNVAPVFAESEYTVTAAESLAAGVAIATVVTTDADAGDTLGYTIVSGDADGLFVIDANGVITLASGKALDYETPTSHTLTVEVDEITGGKGDDKIDLGASDTDTDVVIYGIGGQSAKDGSDNISNFNRGVDQFVFSLDSNQAGVGDVTDYDSFLDYITKGTATLDDDEFRVQLDLGKDADGKTQIEGLFFHFASSTFYSGGRASLPLMKIGFADPIDEDGIAALFTDENGQSVDALQVLNKYFFITDLDVLDDFMGGADSITYEIA